MLVDPNDLVTYDDERVNSDVNAVSVSGQRVTVDLARGMVCVEQAMLSFLPQFICLICRIWVSCWNPHCCLGQVGVMPRCPSHRIGGAWCHTSMACHPISSSNKVGHLSGRQWAGYFGNTEIRGHL
jgi:hypothetical protein